jgi:asparagine synthase (glutamine-hydrolysing)
MCGIICIFRRKRPDQQVQRPYLSDLKPIVMDGAHHIRHRGPDGTGLYEYGCSSYLASMGHVRLSIMDVNGGAQPMVSEDQTLVLVVNGEIFNHKELMKEHCGDVKLKTSSDSECVLHLYKKFGTKCFSMISGQFAIVLLDKAKNCVCVARDHLGIVPLYYGEDLTRCGGDFRSSGLYISSEIKAIQRMFLGDFYVFPTGTTMIYDLEPIFPSPSSSSASSSVLLSDDYPSSASFKNTPTPAPATAATTTPASTVNTKLPYVKNHFMRMEKWYNPLWMTEVPNFPTDIKDFDYAKLKSRLEQAVRRQMMSDVPFGVLLSGGLDSSLIASIAARELRSSSSNQEKKLMTFSIGLEGSPDLKHAKIVAEHIGSDHHEFHFTVEEGIAALRDVIHHVETFDRTTIRASTPMYLMAKKIKALGVKMVLSGEGADEIFGGYLYFHKAPDKLAFFQETRSKLMTLEYYDCLRANKSMMAWGVEVRVPFLDKEFVDYAMNEIDPKFKMCGGKEKKMEKYILRRAFDGSDQDTHAVDLSATNPPPHNTLSTLTATNEKNRIHLPPHILWRQKEQFSDGVGYSWIDFLKEYTDRHVSNERMKLAKQRFTYKTPSTKEDYFYRNVFNDLFPCSSCVDCVHYEPRSIACSSATAILWDKAFQAASSLDPSGRSVLVHVQNKGSGNIDDGVDQGKDVCGKQSDLKMGKESSVSSPTDGQSILSPTPTPKAVPNPKPITTTLINTPITTNTSSCRHNLVAPSPRARISDTYPLGYPSPVNVKRDEKLNHPLTAKSEADRTHMRASPRMGQQMNPLSASSLEEADRTSMRAMIMHCEKMKQDKQRIADFVIGQFYGCHHSMMTYRAEIIENEKKKRNTTVTIDPKDSIVLRYNGSSFKQMMSRLNLLPSSPSSSSSSSSCSPPSSSSSCSSSSNSGISGFSIDMHNILKYGTKKLMEFVNASHGFVQGNTICIIMSGKDRPSYQHKWNGIHDKLVSVTSSYLGGIVTTAVHKTFKNVPSDFVLSFDCRMSVHDLYEDALGVLHWKAYEEMMESIDSTVLTANTLNHALSEVDKKSSSIAQEPHMKDCENVAKMDIVSKIEWLDKRGLWPPLPECLFGNIFYYNPKRSNIDIYHPTPCCFILFT